MEYLRVKIAEKTTSVQRDLTELGEIHRNLLSEGNCPCATGGRCVVAECLERGTEILSDSPPMEAARGRC